mmetsp:Transcript_10865/g.50158  ORF Transcript_10865/g.50158 Transcript_10865/m.50158 type:complete len:337 (-) Transcript_10865:3039-4049(-)
MNGRETSARTAVNPAGVKCAMHCFTNMMASTKHTCAATRNLAALIDRSTSFLTRLRVSAISSGNSLESASIQSLFGMRLLSPLLRDLRREGPLGASGPPAAPLPDLALVETSRPDLALMSNSATSPFRRLLRNVGCPPVRGAHRGDVDAVGWTRARSQHRHDAAEGGDRLTRALISPARPPPIVCVGHSERIFSEMTSRMTNAIAPTEGPQRPARWLGDVDDGADVGGRERRARILGTPGVRTSPRGRRQAHGLIVDVPLGTPGAGEKRVGDDDESPAAAWREHWGRSLVGRRRWSIRRGVRSIWRCTFERRTRRIEPFNGRPHSHLPPARGRDGL